MLKKKTSDLEQLSKEHEEAVKSSTAKNDYLANMSNEIKTPIHAMMVKADELLHVVDRDSPYRKDIRGIYDIGNDILASVDDIILLAGKGHETYQILPTGTIHFDEREVVADILKK